MRRVVPSACQGCLSNCPVLVTIEDGRAVRVRGNGASAATGGDVCPALAITLEQEYDPDRVLVPLRRRNSEKGRGVDPQFDPVTWDEALDEIADRMMALRRAGHPERFALAKGRSTGIGDVLMGAFPDIYGTPNRFNHDSICADAEKLATGVLDGCYDYHDYDWERTECAILWGADPVASNRQKAHARRALPETLRRGVPVFVVDPRRSLTAELVEREARRVGGSGLRSRDEVGGSGSGSGGEVGGSRSSGSCASTVHAQDARFPFEGERSGTGCWVPIAPGTDGALASAIARVVLAEGLWNRDYVGDFEDGRNLFAEAAQLKGKVDDALFRERFTHGVCTWWNEELFDKTPEWASAQTGVAAEEIVRMARAFGGAGECAVSWASPGVAMTARGLYSGMACYALNGLVGSIGAEGGVLSFPSLPIEKLPSTEAYCDDVARRACATSRVDAPDQVDFLCAKAGRAHKAPVTNLIPEAIESGGIDTLIAYWCNFPFSCTGAPRWERALEKLPFLVHVTTHLSEMSHYADIVLPARHHLFETWGFARCRQNGRSAVVLEQPCVDARGEARNDEAGVAYALAEKLADRGFPNILAYYQRECADPCTGAAPTSGDELAEYATRAMTARLWRRDGAGVPGDAEATENVGSVESTGSAESAGDAWRAFRSKGIWESDPVCGRAKGEESAPLPTPSGCFEFESGALHRAFGEHARRFGVAPDDVAASLGYEARGRKSLVPHFEPPRRLGDELAYPFVLSQHRSIANLEGRSANSPLYQRLKRLDPGDEPWDDVVKIHPDDMDRLGLRSGDAVRIVSAEGSITARAKAWDGTRPGVVVKCYGQGHWAYGRVAAVDFEHGIPRGGNNNEIIPAEWERASGATARHGGLTRVRIERA